MKKNIDPLFTNINNYPNQLEIQTQFGDMDVLGHINNVSLCRYYESARTRFHFDIFGEDFFRKTDIAKGLLIDVHVRFLAETHFPKPVVVATGIKKIGNSSLTIAHGLFQDQRFSGYCEATMVMADQGKTVVITDEDRTKMQQLMMRS